MITIVGAGPVGCYAAYLLAKAGKQVQIFEEHYNIGKPVQCAGLVTKKILDILDFRIDKVIINKISRAIILSQNKKLSLKFKNPDLLLDREKFDLLMAKKAVMAGAKLMLGYKFLSLTRKNKKIIVKLKNLKKNKIELLKTDILIGADGPRSKIARFINKKKIRLGSVAQVRMRLKKPASKNTMQIWLGLLTKFFCWFVPEDSKTARLGLGDFLETGSSKNLKKFLQKFEGKILEYQGGLVPLYSKIKVCDDNIYIVGDAACQVKASTGGGIVPGLQAAKCLAKAIIEGKSYEKELKSLNSELNLHLKIRKIINKFSDHDYDMLLELLDKPKVRKILESFSRDGYRKKALRLLLAQKKLLLFARKFF